MPSPFPGMDPYLEGFLWPDVHHRLATEISRRLTPLIRPRYVARIEVYVVEDGSPEAEIGILYPDVDILKSGRAPREPGSGSAKDGKTNPSLKAPVSIPVLNPVEVRLCSVEIRDAARNELVTSIEIVSPVNKREPGLAKYRRRRERFQEGGVHLLEIDLLRRGTRSLADHPRLPVSHYLITLTRSRASNIEVWPLRLQEPMPAVPVPLRPPDPDVALEIQEALNAIYDEAGYDLSVDYGKSPPPPPLTPGDDSWVKEVLAGS